MMETQQQKIVLDTNIYGELAKERDIVTILEIIITQKKIIFYGIRDVIRKEIRNTPPNIRISGKSLRILLLNLYDTIIKSHELNITNDIFFLGDRYYDAYKEFGGSKSKDGIIKDFLIVACASVNSMDILVSNDNYTMLTENAIRSYNLINKTRGIKIPKFINYIEFRERLFSL